MGVKLQSALGGSVELNAPSTASNFTMTVPAGNGTVATTDQLSMFRNRLFNGDMRINQRGGDGNITIPANNTAYALDRWLHYSGGASSIISRVSSGITEFPLAMQALPQTGCTQLNIEQRLESNNVSDLIGVPCTLSGKIYISNATGVTFRPYWYYPSAVDNWASVTFIQLNSISLVSGTYIDFSATFTPDSNAVRGLGAVLEFTGSIAGKTIRVTGVQLERGTVATSFERRPYAQELLMCQRYYELFLAQAVGSGAANSSFGTHVHFAARKRTYPAVTQLTNNFQYTQSGVTASSSNYTGDESGVLVYRVSNAAFAQFSEKLSASAEL